ncbi:sigma-70 family RNA polymerase sigma factor [Candidatus Poribacteria bacterium]|nr:sigma-70 family RNA polymerase sigma factor [Candidatus Poribacteria bacterium]
MRTDDGGIIQDCLNGKPIAFGILVDKYKTGIYAFVYNELGNFHDAQDVTQEVFLQAYCGLCNLRRWESFSFWLYRIALNLCKKWRRTQSRRPDKAFIEDHDPEMRDSSLSDYHQENLNESLQESLDSLPKVYREVLMLYYFGGMSTRDIARAIGISPAAVRKRMSRARAQLRVEMIPVMTTAFDGQRLQADFTFRVVEAIKGIKIHPMPRNAGLPWGMSIAIGIVIAVLGLNPRLNIFSDVSFSHESPRLIESKVLKTGEIPTEIINLSETSVISSKQGNKNNTRSQQNLQNDLSWETHDKIGKWAKKSDMPTPRSALAASLVRDKIYVVGGISVSSEYIPIQAFPAVEEYNPSTNSWIKRADMPTTRAALSTSVVNNKIYAIGGAIGEPMIALSSVEEYDPERDVWTKKADMHTKRWILTTCVVNDKIYAIGGHVLGGGQYATVEEYDPETDTWTKKADMPTPRENFSASVVNGKIYAIGGWNDTDKTLSVVEEYDPKTNTWVKKADMPDIRWGHGTCVLDDRIYVIGGGNGSGMRYSNALEYNPSTDKWKESFRIHTPAVQLATSAFNGKIYAIGGYNGEKALGTVEEYSIHDR